MSSLLKPSRAFETISLCGCMALLVFAGCRSQNESAAIDNTSPETLTSSTPPFQTKEPDRYRATRTITIVSSNGETLVTRTSIARHGERRLSESEVASKKVIYLEVMEGRFALLPDEKVYAEIAAESDLPSGGDDEPPEISPERLLHSEAGQTSYQKVGTDVIGGRNTNKYRVVVNSSTAGSVSVSETMIWIDETLQMPIRSETRSSDGVRATMELSDLTTDVDGRLFQLPNGYEKIAFNEFRRRLSDRSAGVESQPRR